MAMARDTLPGQMTRSHGTGTVDRRALAHCGKGVVFEPGALVFHPENISIGADVYVGHYAILKGYYRNTMAIGDGSWIGQQAFLHAAGGIVIGRRVGIGPAVKILTSSHRIPADPTVPIMDGPLDLAPVEIGDGSDIGAGAIILPGVTIGAGVQIGAGAVVTRSIADGVVALGVPARIVRHR